MLLVRTASTHIRLTISALVAVLVYGVLYWQGAVVRFLIAFDVGAALWLALVFVLVLRSPPTEVRRHAAADDEGAWVILLAGFLVTAVSLISVVTEAGALGSSRLPQNVHVVIAVVTLILAWLFFHTLFALHYARDYYRDHTPKTPRLAFPGTTEPDYWDFLYFAFNIGTASQTADVSIPSSHMRRLVLAHQIASYLFNAAVIALGVNVAAGLM